VRGVVDVAANARQTTKRRRGGGSRARKEARAKAPIAHLPALVREIPTYELLDEEGVALVHDAAMGIVEEVGVSFGDAEALSLWREAGAEIEGERVHIPRELLLALVGLAPSEFTLHARNPERSVRIGGRHMIFSPNGGAYIRDLNGLRRRPVRADLPDIVKLVHCAAPLHVTTGWPAIDLSDVPVSARHLDQIYCPFRYSDKPISANGYTAAVAEDALNMCRIVFGDAFLESKTLVTTLANCNSPLKWDGTMLEGVKVFARAGQGVLCSPFVIYGASTPPHALAAMAQVIAEALSAVALIQLIRPGTPAIFALAPMGVSMSSGAPTWGVPEISHLVYMSGQMARHYDLPWRVLGPVSGSKIADFTAGQDAGIRAHQAILAGCNWITHCGGGLEDAMQLDMAKLMLDAELMEANYVLARGPNRSDLREALRMFRDLRDESHFLGADYTREHMPFMPTLQDNEVHESWAVKGSLDARARGRAAALSALERYADDPPTLDPAIDEALLAFVHGREKALGCERGD
jgi:trimethylamine--corrinoid protein Co-methyltransferase